MSKTYKSYDEEFKKTLVSLYENGKKISYLSRYTQEKGGKIYSKWKESNGSCKKRKWVLNKISFYFG